MTPSPTPGLKRPADEKDVTKNKRRDTEARQEGAAAEAVDMERTLSPIPIEGSRYQQTGSGTGTIPRTAPLPRSSSPKIDEELKKTILTQQQEQNHINTQMNEIIALCKNFSTNMALISTDQKELSKWLNQQEDKQNQLQQHLENNVTRAIQQTNIQRDQFITGAVNDIKSNIVGQQQQLDALGIKLQQQEAMSSQVNQQLHQMQALQYRTPTECYQQDIQTRIPTTNERADNNAEVKKVNEASRMLNKDTLFDGKPTDCPFTGNV